MTSPLAPLPTRPLRPLFVQAARLFGLPAWPGESPAPISAEIWLEAQAMQESSGNPQARRYERALDLAPDADTRATDDHLAEDDASYGLMQILGSTYKGLIGIPRALPAEFSILFNPMFNLCIACVLLQQILRGVEGSVPRALARYNGGGRGDLMLPEPGGKLVFRRQEYVDAVARRVGDVLLDRQVVWRQGAGGVGGAE
jgi:hypothetical protein